MQASVAIRTAVALSQDSRFSTVLEVVAIARAPDLGGDYGVEPPTGDGNFFGQ